MLRNRSIMRKLIEIETGLVRVQEIDLKFQAIDSIRIAPAFLVQIPLRVLTLSAADRGVVPLTIVFGESVAFSASTISPSAGHRAGSVCRTTASP